MPRKPGLRYDKTNKRWRTRINGKTFWFDVEYATSVEKFARVFKEQTGAAPAIEKPLSVAGLVLTWLGEHGYCTDPKEKAWTPRERWGYNMSVKFADHLKGATLRNLKADCVVGYRDSLLKKYSSQTVKHYINFAMRILAWGQRHRFIDPAIQFERPKVAKTKYVPKDLSIAEVRKFLDELKSEPRRERAARIARFMLETGARSIEARQLRWRHVRLDAGTCHLMPGEHKTGKQTGESRTIYLTDEAAALLASLRPRGAKPDEFVFKSRLGKPYTQAGLRAIFKRCGVYPYQLRHTFAQSFVDQGGDIAALQVAMNHKSATTTAQYSEVRAQRVLTALKGVASPSQLATRLQPADQGEHPPAEKPKRKKQKKKGRKKTGSKTRRASPRKSANGRERAAHRRPA